MFVNMAKLRNLSLTIIPLIPSYPVKSTYPGSNLFYSYAT